MLTKERQRTLADFINADKKRAEQLFSLKPEETVSQINALGYNFTLDEIKNYIEASDTAAIIGAMSATM